MRKSDIQLLYLQEQAMDRPILINAPISLWKLDEKRIIPTPRLSAAYCNAAAADSAFASHRKNR